MTADLLHIERRWYDTVAQLRVGTLHFVAPNGERRSFSGPVPGPQAQFAITDWRVLIDIIARGDIGLGEAFIEGAWDTDDIEALFALFLLNMDAFDGFAHGSLLQRLGFVITNSVINRNSLHGSKRNIRAHYDVGNAFYRTLLDETMTYSSALFGGEDISLEQAQKRKYGRILEKVEAGRASVLEVGCGWGGFAEEAVGANCDVTGITISQAQHAFATERLGGKADIRLEDYRETRGTFDRIVSIEMFEAVGERYWPRYFTMLRERLRRGGAAVIQTITIGDDLFSGYRRRSDFIRHYVFPGGLLPSLHRFRQEAERAGLKVVDVFSFGQDYARTLRLWGERLTANEAKIRELGYGESFLRTWRFYLAMCAATFAVARTDVAQIELRHA